MWNITRLVEDFLGKCTVHLELEVEEYGTANGEQKSISSFFLWTRLLQHKIKTIQNIRQKH
jgi:hypothetical protein